jgi:hypothetical protein
MMMTTFAMHWWLQVVKTVAFKATDLYTNQGYKVVFHSITPNCSTSLYWLEGGASGVDFFFFLSLWCCYLMCCMSSVLSISLS